jgi:hypothetical protein
MILKALIQNKASNAILVLLMFLFITSFINAANRFSVASGNWNSIAVWSDTSGGTPGFSVPVAGDVVTIGGGFNVTLSNDAACTSVIISSGATLDIATFKLSVSGTGTPITPTGTFTISSGTVEYSGGAQTCAVLTYNNLILSGSGNKTFATSPTVNGKLLRTGSAAILVTTGNLVYGTNGSVEFVLTGDRTTSANDWLGTMNCTGGVIISNGGGGPWTLTMGGARILSSGVPLTIGAGCTLDTSAGINRALTLGGNFTNNGIFNANASNITFSGTADQSIAGFTTTGTVSMTKTAGIATLTGVLNAGVLTMNTAGGTLDLGALTTHTISGVWTFGNGTLKGSGTLNIGGNHSGNVAGIIDGETINFNGSSAQTVTSGLTYNNLIFSGTGTKTLGAPIMTNGTLTVNSGTTFATANFGVTLGGDFINNGTFTAGSSPITFSGTVNQSIAGFTTTGTVTMTKTAGTATLLGNVNGGALTMNTAGGTLNLGIGLTHTFTGNLTRGLGTLNGGSSSLIIGGTITAGDGFIFNCGSGTVECNGANQTIFTVNSASPANSAYNNLILSGSGTKTLGSTSGITTNGTLEIKTGVTLDTTSTNNCAVNLGGDFMNSGTFTANASTVTIFGTKTQSIAGFTTTGTVAMTKTAGVATLTGDVNAGVLTINGVGGTLHLGSGLTHTISGTWTRTNGTVNGGSSTLSLSANSTAIGTGFSFAPNTSTVRYTAGNQSHFMNNYYNLAITGALTGTCTTGASNYTFPTANFMNIENQFTLTNGQLIFPSNFMLSVTDAVSVASPGALTFENSSSLVQVNTVSNTGNITYKRNTGATKKFDYAYLSTPVNGTAIDATNFPNWRLDYAFAYATANFIDAKTIINGVEISTTPDGFDDDDNDWVAASSMAVANGYIIRVPDVGKAAPGETISFSGVPNNGDISVAIALSGDADRNTDWNLIGNPYPSAVDAEKFIFENSALLGTNANTSGAIDGTIYFWNHGGGISVSNPGPDTLNYTSDSYTILNLTGNASGGTSYIPAGQAFFVEAISTGNVVFKNNMRVGISGSNSTFYKQKPNYKTTAKNRFWLNLKNEVGVNDQQLFGYFPNTTLGHDSAYDGPYSDSGKEVSFYSFIDDKTYAIQNRSAFVDTDFVRLGYYSAIAGKLSVSITATEGIFDTQGIILEDKETNTLYDLQSGAYTFETKEGTFDNRFVLRYTNKTLDTKDFESQSTKVLVSVKNKQIKIQSLTEPIDKIVIYDMLGRVIYQKSNVDTPEYAIQNLPSNNQTLIVKTSLRKGETFTNKIVF